MLLLLFIIGCSAVFYGVYRLFVNAEEWYGWKSTDFDGFIKKPGLALLVLVPIGVGLLILLIVTKLKKGKRLI